MDRRNRKKAPAPGMVWSERHGMWTHPDTRSPKTRAEDEKIATSEEADQRRICETLRQTEKAQKKQRSVVEEVSEKVAQALLASLLEARQKAGFSQAEVARRMGVPQPVIVRLESGTHSPTLSTMARYAAAIGVVMSVRQPA